MRLTFTGVFAKNAMMVVPTLRGFTCFNMLGGQIDLMFISLVTGAEQVRAGKLRAYGVTSEKRQSLFPDLPAIGETVPGFVSVAWFGVFAPANLPDAITEKLNAAIVAALAGPKLRDQLKAEGATAVGNSPREFATFVREDIERWAPLVRSSGATPN
jgi:tripartite-type tricarboxylate transporter receptor subunit TctC